MPGERRRVSPAGGLDPQWRTDRRELYYISPNGMLTLARITPGNPIVIGQPEPLFRINPEPWSVRLGFVYAPMPEGQSFLVNELTGTGAVRLMAVMNWTVIGPQ